MYRGSTALLQHSSKVLIPVIEAIAKLPKEEWDFDENQFDKASVEKLIKVYNTIGDALKFEIKLKRKGEEYTQLPSATLITKILLGVFGCTPAMDEYFCKGFGVWLGYGGYINSRNKVVGVWQKLGTFCEDSDNQKILKQQKFKTLPFTKGGISYPYPVAKLLDMAYFQKGAKMLYAEKGAKANASGLDSLKYVTHEKK